MATLVETYGQSGSTATNGAGLLTLVVTDRDRTAHPARALSDGTLRFLALAVIDLDPEGERLLCLEEKPENGIHPERIPAMLELLQDISVDADEPSDRITRSGK